MSHHRKFAPVLVPLVTLFLGGVSVGGDRLPAPPLEVPAPPGWSVEHLAFALGHSGKVVGGPARWAIGGGFPISVSPVEQAAEPYLEQPKQRLYLADKNRHVWLVEEGQAWPIVGGDQLGQTDGPAENASFVYGGVYGGAHDGMVASGHNIYLMDAGRLRRIARQTDGTWTVTTAAGRGNQEIKPGESGKLAEIGSLGKGLAIAPDGTLYFTLAGGLLKADAKGTVHWVITAKQAQDQMAAIYAREFPGAEPRGFGLGSGESVKLIWHDGEIYGLGRTWPNAWKVTAEGKFVPLVGFAPNDQLFSGRWGKGSRARYEVHCPMGVGIWPGGQIIFQNEIPYATARYDADQVSVLMKDGNWALPPSDSKDYYQFQTGHPTFYADGSIQTASPQPFPSGSMWIRLRTGVAR